MDTDRSKLEIQAAEYVLGTLRGPQRDIFEAKLREDEQLQQVVARWQDRLTPLAAVVRPIVPPPTTWQRISRSVGFPDPVRTISQANRDAPKPTGDAELSAKAAQDAAVKARADSAQRSSAAQGADPGTPDLPSQRTASQRGRVARPDPRPAPFDERELPPADRTVRPQPAPSAPSAPGRVQGTESTGVEGPTEPTGNGPVPKGKATGPSSGSAIEDPENDPAALRQQVSKWRAGAIGAGVLALILAFFVAQPADDPQPRMPDQLWAILAPTDAAPVWSIRYNPGLNRLQVDSVAPAPALSDAVYELWMLAPGDGPISLGVLPPNRQREFTLPAELRSRVSVGVGLAVTVEPAGGSASGEPSGPIVHSGRLEPVIGMRQ